MYLSGWFYRQITNLVHFVVQKMKKNEMSFFYDFKENFKTGVFCVCFFKNNLSFPYNLNREKVS